MRFALLVVVLLLAGCSATQTLPPPPASTGGPGGTPSVTPSGALRLQTVLEGLTSPVLVLEPPDASGRLFVVEQDGLVRVAKEGRLLDAPFLDIVRLVASGGERGLLGMAFAPDFAESGRFFVSYTDNNGDSVLARYHAEAGADVAGAGARIVLVVAQPYANHNGGHVAFGPDGFLYFGLGDGGSGGDPEGNGQDATRLLGSMLRLDVSGDTYTSPSSNPYVRAKPPSCVEGTLLSSRACPRAEVWAKGLRNPWRFSFDRATGDLYIGDVGQNKWEEIDFQPASSLGGENYGWNVFEGNERYKLVGEPSSPVTAPVHVYPNADGCAVTGGHVLRGPATPSFAGTYVFADYCNGKVFGLRHDGAAWRSELLLATEARVSSFSEDQKGNVYLVDHGGRVYLLTE